MGHNLTASSRIRDICALLLSLCLALTASAARAEWREATSEHFVIVSEGSERDIIRASQRLEAVHWLLSQATNQREIVDGQRVRVYLVDNPILLRNAAGVPAGSNIIGIYFSNPTIPTALAVRDRPESDLFHEYGHHFMGQYMPMQFPHWFVEGFAEVISTASFEMEGRITYGKVANERQYELQDGPWTPMERMFAQPGDDEGRGSNHAGVASYGQYWVTTHYLLFAPERRGQLARYIAAISRGADFTEAAETSFTGGLEQLDHDVRSYLRRANFQYRPVPLPEGVMRTPTLRSLRPSEAAILRLEMEAARTWESEEVDALLPRIEAAVAQYPQEPAVHALHAATLAQAERFNDAVAAADRGIAADPNHARSIALRAYALFRHAVNEGEVNDALLAEVRTAAERARQGDPGEPLLRLIRSMTAPQSTRTSMRGGQRITMTFSSWPAMQVTAEQRDRIVEGMTLLTSDINSARRVFAAIAADYPDTDVARYAQAWVDWFDGGQTGMPPGVRQPTAPVNPASPPAK